MMDITFVVLTYNQEELVIESLESIKYQVKNYLIEKKVQLIISDDCSADNTVINVQKWLKKNQNLFERVDLVTSIQHKGTCCNVASAYRLIAADRFVSLAADDLLSNIDIFSILCKYSKTDLVACVPDYFSENKMLRDEEKYRIAMIPCFFSEKQFVESSRRDSAIINGGFYGRELLDEDVLTFIEKFRLLDDQARYFYMISNNDRIGYDFCNEPILMYRVSEQQVTNKKGKFWKDIVEDKKKLIKYTIREEPRLKNKISIVLSLIAIKFPNIYAYIFSSLDPAVRRNKNILEKYNESIQNMINNRLKEERIAEKERYINYIYFQAKQFIVDNNV